jgi:hypothetical protein
MRETRIKASRSDIILRKYICGNHVHNYKNIPSFENRSSKPGSKEESPLIVKSNGVLPGKGITCGIRLTYGMF